MNILVLNGSPKGENSVTLQTVRYLEKRYPSHIFTVLNVGQRIKALEKDLPPALEAMKKAGLLLFSYPVYTFIAPYQLHRFIELVKESGINLNGKYATQLTTSKHFYDVTAHNYVRDNIFDLGMKHIRGLIWLMQGMMRADHKFYKAHGQYDFPQKKSGRMLAMYLVGAMLASPKLKPKAGGKMTEGMLMPYQKVLKNVHPRIDRTEE